MKTIIKYYGKYTFYIIASLLFLTGEAVCELQLPELMSKIVSDGIGRADMGQIWHFGWQMLVVSLIACVCAVAVGFFSSKVAACVSRDLRSDMFKKVMDFANEEYNKFSVSSLITRSTNDITQIQMLTILFLRLIMFAPIMGVGGAIKAVEKSSGISALAIVIAVAIAIVIALIILALAVVQPKFMKMQKQIDAVNQIANDELNGMLVIRAFNTQSHEEQRFDKANKDLTDTSLFTSRMMALLMPVMTVVMNGVMLAIVWIFSYKNREHRTGIGYDGVYAILVASNNVVYDDFHDIYNLAESSRIYQKSKRSLVYEYKYKKTPKERTSLRESDSKATSNSKT